MEYNKDKGKKVLFVVHSFINEWKAGVENYTFALARELIKSGADVSFLYPKIEEYSEPQLVKENFNGIKLFKLITNNKSQLFTELESDKYDKIFEELLIEEKYGTVHFHHFYGLPLSFAGIVKKLGIKLFVTLHDFWLVCPRIHFFINEQNSSCNIIPDPFACAKCLMPENKAYQIELADILIKRKKNVRDILNSADYISAPSKFVADKFSSLNIFKSIEVAELGMERIPRTEKKVGREIVFGYIGSIAPVKNVMTTVKTFKDAEGNKRFLIYGNGSSGEINKLIHEIENVENIEYRGEYTPDELKRIFSEIDVVVIPSFIETYSFTVREALSANKPVIASNVGAIPDIVTNNKNGLLFSPYIEGDLKRAIERVIESPELLQKLSSAKTEIKLISDDAKFWLNLYQRNFKKPKVSIIIPVFNKLELTKQCISSIFENTLYPNYEIIVFDNASSDGTKEYLTRLKQNSKNVKVIFSKKNLGFAKANNLASEVAEGKYLQFLNNDTQVQKYWLTALVEIAENDENVSAVGSKLLFPNKTIQHTGVVLLGKRYEISPVHFLYKYPQNIRSFSVPKFFRVLTAASLLVRKKSFLGVNKYCEEYWNGYEDVDLCFKLNQAGGTLVLEPRSLVIHYESQSGPERFVATEKNINLLNRKWKGKIENDLIIQGKTLTLNTPKVTEDYYANNISDKSASIIIVTFNSENTIGMCLNSVIKTLRDKDEIIIVDNFSADNTLKIISEFAKENSSVKVISEKLNHGFSKGCNIGIEASSNPFIILLNPDTVVYGNWIEKMIVHFNNPYVGAVGPLSDYVAGFQKYEFYFPAKENQTIGDINAALEEKYSGAEKETKLLIGFCIALKQSIVNKLGALDEDLFLGNDDLEISWRLRLAGYKLVISLDTFVSHIGQQSFITFDADKRKEFVEESTNALYKKLNKYYGENNVPTPQTLWGINWFRPRDGVFHKEKELFDIKEMYQYQFDIKKKNIMVSLIVPVFNQIEVTREFLTSVGEEIPWTMEIIIIDNNSDYETGEFLENYAQLTNNVTVIKNKENFGFPKAINQGLRMAKGEFIFIANNDIILPPNWLENMIKQAERDPQIGLVGPVSNKVSGVQKVKELHYSTENELFEYMEGINNSNKGKYFEFPRIAFLFTLIKRKVIETIGGLDERFTPGNYEDDDYCLRAQLAGFKTVIALDVFVHHYGSKSFTAEGEERYGRLLEKNKKKFIEKWGGTPDDIWLKGKSPLHQELNIPLNLTFIDFVNIANKALESKNYKESLINLQNAIDRFDKTSGVKITDLLMLAAKIAKLLNESETAEKYLLKLIEIDGSASEPYVLLGGIYEEKKEFDKAINFYEQAYHLNKDELLGKKINQLKNNLITKS